MNALWVFTFLIAVESASFIPVAYDECLTFPVPQRHPIWQNKVEYSYYFDMLC